MRKDAALVVLVAMTLVAVAARAPEVAAFLAFVTIAVALLGIEDPERRDARRRNGR